MSKIGWRLIPLVLFTVLGCFFWHGLTLNPQYLPSARINKKIPHFQLAQLGNAQALFTEESLYGRITLLNIWASWCASCAEEQVFLLKLARDGYPIYGLNYKDNSKKASEWLAEWGNPYRVIGEDNDGRVAIDLGVYGTPETFLIDQHGFIRYRYAGVLNAAIWAEEFLPRIRQLEQEAV